MQKNSVLYILLQFFYYFNFFWLIQNVYFLEHGISYTQLSIVLGVWALSIVVFEIPSGILADKISRKFVIITGKVAFLLGILVVVFSPNFAGFVLGAILLGVHESFISGAQEALVYDHLKEKGHESRFKKIFSLATTGREVGLGVGAILAGFVTQIGVNYNLIGSIIIGAVGVVLALFLEEPHKHSKSEEAKFINYFKSASAIILSKDILAKIVIFSVTVMMAYQIVTEYFIISLKQLNIPYSLIGIIAFGEMLCFSLGSYVSQKIHLKHNKKAYVLTAGLMALAMIMTTRGTIYLVIAGWFLMRSFKAVGEIVSGADWQENIESHHRATATSIRSFLLNLLYILFAFTFGLLADKYGLFASFYLTAFLSILYVFFVAIDKPSTTVY